MRKLLSLFVLLFFPGFVSAVCTINTASWDSTQAADGNSIGITLTGNADCDTEQVDYDIRETDDSTYANAQTVPVTNPPSSTFSLEPLYCGDIEPDWSKNAVFTKEIHVMASGGGDYSQLTDIPLGEFTPGTKIIVHEGNYDGGIAFVGISGTLQNPIMIMGAPGEQMPVIQGGGDYQTCLKYIDSNYWIIEGLKITLCDDAGIGVDDGDDAAGYPASKAHHIIIRKSFFTDINNGFSGNTDSIKLAGVDDFWIYNNTFDDRIPGRPAGNLVTTGIDGVGIHDGIMAYNQFYNQREYAMVAKGGSSRIVYLGNYVENDAAVGNQRLLHLGGVGDACNYRPQFSKVQANYITAIGNVVKGSTDASGFEDCVNCTLAHNVFYLPKRFAVRFLNSSGANKRCYNEDTEWPVEPMRGNVLANNIYYYSSTQMRGEPYSWGNVFQWVGGMFKDSFVFSNNIYYDLDGQTPNYDGGILLNEQTNTDPLFVDPSNNDFSVRSGSPAVGAGVDLNELKTTYNQIYLPTEYSDILGNCFYPSTPTIGAYEKNPPLGGSTKTTASWTAEYNQDNDADYFPEYVFRASLNSNPNNNIDSSNELKVGTTSGTKLSFGETNNPLWTQTTLNNLNKISNVDGTQDLELPFSPPGIILNNDFTSADLSMFDYVSNGGTLSVVSESGNNVLNLESSRSSQETVLYNGVVSTNYELTGRIKVTADDSVGFSFVNVLDPTKKLGLINQRAPTNVFGVPGWHFTQYSTLHATSEDTTFKNFRANTWMNFKFQVVSNGDGTSDLYVKFWYFDESEPAGWTTSTTLNAGLLTFGFAVSANENTNNLRADDIVINSLANVYSTSGTVYSDVIDTAASQMFVSNIFWDEIKNNPSTISVQFRASNSIFGLTDMSPPWTNITNNQLFGIPSGRYVQWRADITGDGSSSSVLEDLTITYTQVSSQPGNIYDLNGDSLVDLTDLTNLIVNFGSSQGKQGCVGSRDFNNDLEINILDLIILIENFS